MYALLSVNGDAARAGRRQLVDVDEQALVRVARVEREHPVVHVLLDALALVARCQSAARSSGEQAGLHALGLRVVRNVLHDDAPLAVDVLGADRAGVQDLARADVAFAADPVALVERLAVVERVVKVLLLERCHAIDQVVGRLVSHFGVFLQDERVVLDGVLLQTESLVCRLDNSVRSNVPGRRVRDIRNP